MLIKLQLNEKFEKLVITCQVGAIEIINRNYMQQS